MDRGREPATGDNPAFCKQGSTSTRRQSLFPLEKKLFVRQTCTIRKRSSGTLIDMCASSQHLMFAEDAAARGWWFQQSGRRQRWVFNTKMWIRLHDVEKSQGWTPIGSWTPTPTGQSVSANIKCCELGRHVQSASMLRFRIVHVGLTRAFLERKSDCRRVSRSLLAEGWVVPVAGRGRVHILPCESIIKLCAVAWGNSYGFSVPQ